MDCNQTDLLTVPQGTVNSGWVIPDSLEPWMDRPLVELLSSTVTQPTHAPVLSHNNFATPAEAVWNVESDTWATRDTVHIDRISGRDRRRLAELNLSEWEFECFKSHFVGHPFRYCVKYTEPRGKPNWISVPEKQPLTNWQLIGHINGTRWIATEARWNRAVGEKGRMQTRFFVIDLDNHAKNDSPRGDLTDRYSRTVGALGAPSAVFQSSDSGGLHLYYVLTEPVDLYRLKDKSGAGGVVTRLLRAHGLTEESGAVELYPTGKRRGEARKNRLRIPFGAQSRLLDATTLQPIHDCSGVNDLRLVADSIRRGAFPLHVFADLFERAQLHKDANEAVHPASRRVKRGGKGQHPTPLVLTRGLDREGQRNAAIRTATFNCWRRGYSEHEVAEHVVAWLDGHHNGFSTTYNTDPDGARAEARETVRGIFRSRGVYRAAKELPPISVADVLRIVNTPAPDPFSDPRSGQPLKLYRLHSLLFDSIKFAKQWVYLVVWIVDSLPLFP